MYSLREFYEIVENEGLEYTITCYLNPENIEDEEISKLAIVAKEALLKIEEILEKFEEELEE